MALTEPNPKVSLTATGWLDCGYREGHLALGRSHPGPIEMVGLCSRPVALDRFTHQASVSPSVKQCQFYPLGEFVGPK